MFIYDLCNALGEAKIPYAIVGGYAVALHGASRATMDIDIVIVWNLKNLKAMELVLKELGLVSMLPIDAESVFNFRKEYIKNRNLIAWNFYDPKNPSHQVDVVISYDLKNARIKTISTRYGKLKVLSREDLIAMKKASGRPQDLVDIEALEKI